MRLLRKMLQRGPEIVKAGHPALRRVAQPLSKEDIKTAETVKLVKDMVASIKRDKASGVSAPQLGASKRIVAYEITAEMMHLESKVRNLSKLGMEAVPLTVLYNLDVKPLGKATATHREGCLSVPGFSAHVQRALAIEATALDEDGKAIKFRASGWTARVLQHEHDHLEGKLFIDRMLPATFADERERWEHPLTLIDRQNDGEFDPREEEKKFEASQARKKGRGKANKSR